MIRKSSRGNPYHDERGRFCSSDRCLSISELTKEEYAERSELREIQANHKRLIASYEQKIEKSDRPEDLEEVLNNAEKDIGVSDVEYCDLYSKAMKKVRTTHTPTFYQAEAAEFKDSFNYARNSHPSSVRWRVDSSYTVNDYRDMNLYIADDGSSYAIHDGDIVSVCAVNGGRTKGKQLLEQAVKSGGIKLDAYSGLFSFYTKCGFEPVSICKWEDEYAPDDWIEANGFTDDSWKNKDDSSFKCAREDIVFFKYTGKKQYLSFEDWASGQDYDADYEAAMKRRDSNL